MHDTQGVKLFVWDTVTKKAKYNDVFELFCSSVCYEKSRKAASPPHYYILYSIHTVFRIKMQSVGSTVCTYVVGL